MLRNLLKQQSKEWVITISNNPLLVFLPHKVCLFGFWFVFFFNFKFDCLDLILWIYWVLKVIHLRDIPRTLIHHRDIHHRDIHHNRDIPNKDILHLQPMLLNINSLLLNNRVAVLAAWKAGNNNNNNMLFNFWDNFDCFFSLTQIRIGFWGLERVNSPTAARGWCGVVLSCHIQWFGRWVF